MTTHRLEVRCIAPTNGHFFSLTREPISKRDAENLLSMLGPHWEGRIVVASSPVGREFAELESLADAKRWEKARISHHPHCAVNELHQRTNEQWTTHAFGDHRNDVLTGEEWRVLRTLELAATTVAPSVDAISVSKPVIHDGRCPDCGGTKRALSVFVQITQGDKVSTREYAL